MSNPKSRRMFHGPGAWLGCVVGMLMLTACTDSNPTSPGAGESRQPLLGSNVWHTSPIPVCFRSSIQSDDLKDFRGTIKGIV